MAERQSFCLIFFINGEIYRLTIYDFPLLSVFFVNHRVFLDLKHLAGKFEGHAPLDESIGQHLANFRIGSAGDLGHHLDDCHCYTYTHSTKARSTSAKSGKRTSGETYAFFR